MNYRAMNPRQLQTLIAERLGWVEGPETPPDWFRNSTAMFELEERLTIPQARAYAEILRRRVNELSDIPSRQDWLLIHPYHGERCIAWLQATEERAEEGLGPTS